MAHLYTKKELEHIKSNMKIFHNLTELPCMLIDQNGETVHQEGDQSAYCQRIQFLLDDNAPCTQSHLSASKQAEELGEAYIFFCPVGLVHLSVAIKSGEVFSGAIIVGPIQMSEPDIYEVEHLLKTYPIAASEKGLLATYYNAIPIIPSKTVRYQLQLLTILGKDIMSNINGQFQKKKEFFDEQRTLSEHIQELKELKEYQGDTGIEVQEYPLHLEKELGNRILRGDEMGAKAILNELLGYIFFRHRGDNKMIIAMSIELIVVMSRAAIEGGAKHGEVSKITNKLYEQTFNSEDIEEVCMWLLEIIERFILLVFPLTHYQKEHMSVIKKAVMYMNEHLKKNLSLEEVANYVNLSPTYFSRLFSNEMNTSFIEYLSMIRVEESKTYLSDKTYNISDIALIMGFSDQSYFSKVFKKVEGITPGKYRRMYL